MYSTTSTVLTVKYTLDAWLMNLNSYFEILKFFPLIFYDSQNNCPNAQFTSVQFSCSVVFDCLRPHELRHASPHCPSPPPGVHSDAHPSSWWCHPAISSSVVPFTSCPQSLPASESFPMSQLLHEVAKVLEFQLYNHFFQRNPRADLLQNGLVGSPCSPRDSQESSPTPQFKSINSSVLSFLHSPTLTSIHDHWKNHSLD